MALERVAKVAVRQTAQERQVLFAERAVQARVMTELLAFRCGELAWILTGQVRERAAGHEPRQQEIQTDRDQQDQRILRCFVDEKCCQWPNPGMNESLV